MGVYVPLIGVGGGPGPLRPPSWQSLSFSGSRDQLLPSLSSLRPLPPLRLQLGLNRVFLSLS